MKRLITLIIALVLWAGSSWGQTITIGTQVLQSGTTGIGPTNYYWESRRIQWVITATEITDAGGFAGNIISMAYDVSEIATGNLVNYEVKLGHTTATDASAHNTAALTNVVNAHTFSPGSTGWRTLTFDNPFAWNGVDNILVDVCWGVNSGYALNGQVWLYNDVANQMRGVTSGSTNQCSSTTTTARNGKPRVQLTFLPPSNMTFTSSTTLTAYTLTTLVGAVDQPIIVLQVVTNGTLNPFDITSIDFTTSGTTSTSDITAANVYYTTSPTFSASTQFGSTVYNPSGSFTVTSTQTLAGGNNYFWLCYDISNTATEWNVVDGTCPQFATSEPQTRVPDVTDPAGNRTIRAPLAGTYTIDNTNPTSGTNYNNFTDALNDLNNIGHSAAVTFDVSAGQTFSKTVPASPNNYAYYIMNYIGSASNPVVFQKSGAGTNPVLSITGTSATGDIGMFLYGCDYVTFDGIDINDAGSSSSDYLEWGYYLQGPANDNCQYVTIQNCTIDLNKANTSARGIFTNANAPTSSAGTKSNNTFSGNTIQDAYNGIYLSSNTTYRDENNVVSGNVIQNLGNSLSTIAYGIYAYYQKNVSVTGNSVDNMNGTSTIYGIYSYYWDGLNNYLNDNNVMNLTGTSTSSTMYGLYHYPASTANTQISGNTITGLDHKYNVYGLHVGAGSQNNIFNNLIHNIAYTGTTSYIAYGLSSSGGTTNNIYNNYVYDIKAPASTTSPGTRAMNINGGTTANVFFNTVYIDYTSTVASNQSAALYVTTSPTTLYLNNNIFVNNCDMTTGTRAVAFYKSTTSLANLPNSNNNNLFYAGTPGTKNLIFFDGTNSDQTLAQFQARVTPRESQSFSENPPFVNKTTAPYNLHMLLTTPTQCESGGSTVSSPLAITTDYDGNTRNETTPDVGADEFEGTGQDLVAPDITFTPLPNTASTSSRTLSTSITDASGVPTSGTGRPVLYWSIGGIAQTPVTATYISGDQYDFTFGSGVIAGDTVRYYIVAQDLASTPNVGSNPSGGASGFTANPPACSTPPTTPYSYTILQGIGGSVTVGTSGTYPSLTGTGGLFEDINAKIVTGNITATIISDLTETGTNALNQWTEDGAGNWTLTIQPDGTTIRDVTGSSSGGLIRLNGADRVTFDGRYSGSGKFLNFSNTSTSTSTAVFHLISLGTGAGATDNTIRNCIIAAGSNSVTSTFGIYIGGTSVSTSGSGADNDNLSIIENDIAKAYYGIYARGVGSTGELEGLVIQGNTIGSPNTSDYITGYGINLQAVNGAAVSENEIYNLIYNGGKYGIYLGTYVYNCTFGKNKIHTFSQSNTTAYYCIGIYFSSGTGVTNNEISNNIIYDLYQYGSTSNFYFSGIRIVGGSQYKLYYNSISLTGAFGSTTSGVYSICLMISSSSANMDIRDNIFSNTMTGTSPKNYTVFAITGTTFATIDYNDYYTTGAALGYFGSEKADLAAWQAATGQDASSISGDPLFVSATNLQPETGSPVLATGTPISGITTDILDVTRDATDPSMGAYEEGLAITCAFPTSLSTANITTNSADLDWTAGGTETSWQVSYGSPGFDPLTGGTRTGAIGTHPYNLGSLSSYTSYDWYVRAICGMGDTSLWAGPNTFTTLCDPINTLPWAEGFETATIPSLPDCWLKENGDWVTTNNASSTYDADARTGTQFLRESWSAVDEYVWTPGFLLNAGETYLFSFWWAGDNYSGWTGDVLYNT
ncbi:MAG: right-handed parallel beta-helix repeat-containing protein [Bacteroidales bacterium]|nr:right-handed parallel beta-helix repeat-containing protein [Bacteroidales bacterium]